MTPADVFNHPHFFVISALSFHKTILCSGALRLSLNIFITVRDNNGARKVKAASAKSL